LHKEENQFNFKRIQAVYIDKIRINFQKIIILCQIEFGERRPFHKTL